MRRAWTGAALALLVAAAFWVGYPRHVEAQQGNRAQWIWFDEGSPATSAPAGTRYFRRAFDLVMPPNAGVLDITAAGPFAVWVNGVQVGKGDNAKRVYRFDIASHLAQGRNVLAIQAEHKAASPAGLLVRLGYGAIGHSKQALTGDTAWLAAKAAPEGWEKADFSDNGWTAAKVLGVYNQVGPWRNLTWDAGSDDRFKVPPGFRVELAVKPPAGDPTFSLVNMCFDDKGRLLVSRERGPILLCTNPGKDGVLQTVKPYCTQVKNCQGMCWVNDALLLVGDGPNGTGLYRVRDTQGTDQTDQVTLLHKFPMVDVPNYQRQGGMGEHGPHAILHGPDGWLYLVIGNHAWAGVDRLAANSPLRRWPTGKMGPDQDKPNTTEDVLLPRLNDGRGHASNILAPGGTIWRLDHEGKNWSLVAAGFRNCFDAAFSPYGELFTFDSDMEWDENLPWYRAVRVCHCPPGVDFVWRTGAANTPAYYIDSLPPIYETGRGSPVGLKFYDHVVFPEKYRGAYFMADWSLGVIYATHLERSGASYKATVERFCTGAPMNVTDIGVGPDGALYFVMGGRNTQGGVYRIVYDKAKPGPVTSGQQPLSAWGRAATRRWVDYYGVKKDPKELLAVATNDAFLVRDRIHCLHVLQNYLAKPNVTLLTSLLNDKYVEVRAYAVFLLGLNGYKDGREALLKALKDNDAFVRRRACEALIRAGFEPPVEALWPLLGDPDRFVRHAARLVLERIAPKKWADRVGKETKDLIAWNGIVALCQTNQAAPYAENIFARLRGNTPMKADAQPLLDYLRTVQLALIHAGRRPIWVKGIAAQCDNLFPHEDWRVNRELAILLTEFRREGQLDAHVNGKLLAALQASKGDRQQQIHYSYCLRLIHDGWTPEQKMALAAWYNGTQSWQGGHSFTPFLENIFKDVLKGYTVADRRSLLAHAEKMPLPALVLVNQLQFDREPELVPDLDALSKRLPRGSGLHREGELRQAVDDALSKTALTHQTPAAWPHLLRGLESRNPLVRSDALAALRKLAAVKPKADDPAPYRVLLTAAPTLASARDKWQAVELLRQWNGRSFGAEPGDWKTELKLWSRWFGQTFPKEAALPNVGGEPQSESKYKFAELLDYLTKDPHGRKGDPVRGRLVFEKAQCIKCHKYGKEGEGVGPDLTTLSKRFKRADVLESILVPSKVISDQYRSVTITTTKGQQITGLAAAQGDTVTVLLSDTNKVTLKQSEIESQVASLVSVMPERLLDPLTREQIADLFAFLESEPQP
jgi:putative heme-binding domain-containing protein